MIQDLPLGRDVEIRETAEMGKEQIGSCRNPMRKDARFVKIFKPVKNIHLCHVESKPTLTDFLAIRFFFGIFLLC